MPADTNESIDGVSVAHIQRVFALLRDKFPRVLEANRYFEEQTGLHNEAGVNNIVDAFSHLATLVENAAALDHFAQGEQVAHLEDHLRRSMMEAFEQVVKLRLADVAERWDEFQRLARPLQLRGLLSGVPPWESFEESRDQLRTLLDNGRNSKRAVTWDEWEAGTDSLVEACDVSEKLLQDLQDGIAAAEALAARSALQVVAAAAAVLGIGIAFRVRRAG